MTANFGCVDDLGSLQKLLAETEVLLLDFDGPVCSVFARFPAPVVADQLREVLAEGGHAELPPEVEKSEDPFDVFKHAAFLGDKEGNLIEAALRAHEVEAVMSADPTPGASELVRIWCETGRKLAIVSNNSAAAIEVYLSRMQLSGLVDVVSARRSANTGLLKPSPFLINSAMALTGALSEKCTLVGDSVADIEAAQAVKIRSIGYANKPGKVDALMSAGASVVTKKIHSLVRAIKPT